MTAEDEASSMATDGPSNDAAVASEGTTERAAGSGETYPVGLGKTLSMNRRNQGAKATGGWRRQDQGGGSGARSEGTDGKDRGPEAVSARRNRLFSI